jgi:hypothetical protein
VPKSRVRKKKVYTPPSDLRPGGEAATKSTKRPSPRWVPGLAVALIIAGIAWLVIYYLTSGSYPIASLTAWNLAIGFGLLIASLGVLTQWR